jgi:hypothetical protein
MSRFCCRVKLELKDIESYSLFPGQVILVQGTASSGRVIVAKRLVEGVPRPLPMSSPAKLLEYHHNNRHYQSGQPLHIIVAAGPYTTSENLLYEPFEALLTHIIRVKPDVVVLTGPFVDVNQPLLESGDVVLDDLDDDDNVVGSHAASFDMVSRRAYFSTVNVIAKVTCNEGLPRENCSRWSCAALQHGERTGCSPYTIRVPAISPRCAS